MQHLKQMITRYKPLYGATVIDTCSELIQWQCKLINQCNCKLESRLDLFNGEPSSVCTAILDHIKFWSYPDSLTSSSTYMQNHTNSTTGGSSVRVWELMVNTERE